MLRTLSLEEIGFVSGGMMEDADSFDSDSGGGSDDGGDMGGSGGDFGGDDFGGGDGYSEATSGNDNSGQTSASGQQQTTEAPTVGHTAADSAVCLGSIGLAVFTDGATAVLGGVVGLGSCYVAGEDIANRMKAGGYLNK